VMRPECKVPSTISFFRLFLGLAKKTINVVKASKKTGRSKCNAKVFNLFFAYIFSEIYFLFFKISFFGVTCPIWLSLLFLLFFCHQVVHLFSSSFLLGEARIQTHILHGSDRESSAFTTRPGGFPFYFLFFEIFFYIDFC